MDLKKEIKALLALRDMTMKELNDKLNESKENPTGAQNLSTRLSNGTLKYKEVEEILSILGYHIVWEKNVV
ncbi:LLM class flavin-dependent oxidoreductase [Clostridium manihotivorum]|uniref:Phosphoribosylglycinamide formyltransferase n=1 Tax=Clostridium manihotivorum TaxID=2320868 RepID=A0A410DQ86_9CLOT|nr:LLM class flavin-dependent oxidoreductase [Clostridium manihotivorum]QAA31212.1 phosphoribosylglycinamide formyltransferase [Clostridium manihotivorum]